MNRTSSTRLTIKREAVLHWLALVFLLLATCVSFIPLFPAIPQNDLDPSWMLGVSYATDQHLAFGKDLVFTFGPFANLYTWLYSPKLDGLDLGLGVFFAIAFLLAIRVLLAGRRYSLSLLGVAVVLWLQADRDVLLMLTPVVLCLAWLVTGRAQNRRMLMLLAASPVLGLLPLIKLSFIVISVISVVLIVLILVLRKCFAMALAAAVVPAVSTLLAWLGVGQPWVELKSYLVGALPVISGYTEAMALDRGIVVPAIYAGASLLLIIALWRTRHASRIEGWISLVIAGVFLFLMFKTSFVRDDAIHAAHGGIALLLAALVCTPFARGKLGALARYVVAVAGLAIYSINVPVTNLTQMAVSRVSVPATGLWSRVTDPAGFDRTYLQALTAIAAAAPLPKLDGSVDIYSYSQASVLANELAWKPRPAFQSYSAYTPGLLAMNAEHLQGASAAQYLLFNTQPIDGRLPSLEDGASWPIIYGRYRLLQWVGNSVLLQRTANPDVQLVPLMESRGELGLPIEVPSFVGQVYVQIVLKPTVLGKLQALAYKPDQLTIRTRLQNGESKDYRLIAQMAASPFLISPFVENSRDFTALYAGTDYLKSKRAITFSVIDTAPVPLSWGKHFTVKFYGAVPQSDIAKVNELFGLTHTYPAQPAGISACVSSIDYVDGERPNPVEISAKDHLRVEGWNARADDDGASAEPTVVVLSANGKSFSARTLSYDRPDVAAYFHRPAILDAGYSTVIDLSGLKGHYQLGLGLLRGGKVFVCERPGFAVDIK